MGMRRYLKATISSNWSQRLVGGPADNGPNTNRLRSMDILIGRMVEQYGSSFDTFIGTTIVV